MQNIGDKNVGEGSTLRFSINANDPDADSVTYALSNCPAGATLDATSGEFSWTPNFGQSGDYRVTFTASDGNLTCSDRIWIRVSNSVLVAQVTLEPDALHLNRNGNWLTAYIELPLGFDPDLVDINSIRFNGSVPAVTDPRCDFVNSPKDYITDVDRDKISERMVKFETSQVRRAVLMGNNEITIYGKLSGWPFAPDFSGSFVLRVTD
jgi:hypothetical protein